MVEILSSRKLYALEKLIQVERKIATSKTVALAPSVPVQKNKNLEVVDLPDSGVGGK